MSTFLDTNVLIYAQGTDPKSDIARQAISPGAVISVQVLNEFSKVLHRKHGLGWELVAQRVAKLRETFDIAPCKGIRHFRGAIHRPRYAWVTH